MALAISDTSPPEQFVASGGTLTPFTGVNVSDTINNTEGVLAVMQATGSPALNDSNLGTLSDPMGGGTFAATPASDSFAETGLVTGTPTFGTSTYGRLVYAAPTLPNGQSAEIATFAFIDDNNAPYLADASNPRIIDIVTAPAITGTVADQPVASTGTIRPFSTVNLTDADFNFGGTDTVTITITDGGLPTDADGLLTGSGLSKTGVGTYTIPNADLPFNIAGELNHLVFTPTVLGTGVTKTVNFELDATDTKAKLTSKDTTSSVLVSGPPAQPVPPTIAGTVAGQTVAPGNLIDPFSAVTVSDANMSPPAMDSVTITVANSAGTATDGNGMLTGTGLTETSPGVYTLAAATPAAITTALDNLTFHPTGTGAPPTTTSFKLAVTDAGNAMIATDTTTTVIDQPVGGTGGGGMVTPNFQISDETTGKTNDSAGQTYTGPVAGVTNDLILATSDNINVLADIPNVFIHTGNGNDAIDVSHVNGNNVLDGSTGTNFLTGGTGNDQFFIDERNATSDIFSTIQGFHSGDTATVWGITPADFTITPGDNVLPTAPGLDFAITAPGKPNANFNIPGYSTADLSNGRLTMSFGTSPDEPGLPGSPYMLIQAT